MKNTRKIATAALVAGLFATHAGAADTNTTAAAPTSYSVDMTQDCSGGGTRTVKGSYDATTGALSTTTTLAACVVRNGDKFDGTTTTAGTLLATGTGFTIDITATVDTSALLADGSTVVRKCTTVKQGTFDSTTQTFDGTTAKSNCSVTGKVREHEGIVEHLLRAATGGEDGGGSDSGERIAPPRPGEDNTSSGTQQNGGTSGGNRPER